MRSFFWGEWGCDGISDPAAEMPGKRE